MKIREGESRLGVKEGMQEFGKNVGRNAGAMGRGAYAMAQLAMHTVYSTSQVINKQKMQYQSWKNILQ